MQTRGWVYGQVASLAGDPYKDWLDPAYFDGFCNLAYEAACQKLALTCSPYIEQVVEVPNITIGVDESNLGPNGVTNGPQPLLLLKKPRKIQWKPAGSAQSCYREVKEFSILPNNRAQASAINIDVQVRGDFQPPPLLQDTDVVLIHPNMAHCLSLLTMALIGMERPNQSWIENYGAQGQSALDAIEADLVRQQQRNTFRLGSPNRNQPYSQWNLNSGYLGWEWRGFGLYVKQI